MMLDRCCRLHISLNLKKSILCKLFETLLGHVVCKEGLLFNQVKIVMILDMLAPTLFIEICATLGHIGYYRIFI
jgi:hypothetical protein